MRTFIAIELPDAIRGGLQREIDILRTLPGGRAVRWVSASGIHLTLKFLGEVAPSRIESIQGAMREAAAGPSPFEVSVRGLGVFPNSRRPRVVWVGVEDTSGHLARVQSELEDRLGKLGFEREDRSFHPHLTLGRVRRGASAIESQELGETLAGVVSPEIGSLSVVRLSLMRSDLRPTGAVYSRMGEAPLGGER